MAKSFMRKLDIEPVTGQIWLSKLLRFEHQVDVLTRNLCLEDFPMVETYFPGALTLETPSINVK